MQVFDLKKNIISALSMNSSRDRCLVGGRFCLCLYKIQNQFVSDDEVEAPISIEQFKNLRSKKSSLDYTALEIKWNQSLDQYLIFSSVNSIISLYDMNQVKSLMNISVHRQKSFLDWNPKDPKQFVSGSNDGKILLWTIDSPKQILEFGAGSHKFGYDASQGVESVKFNPHNTFQIASCLKNKKVCIWDQRKQAIPILEYEAHIESPFCVDWHPGQENVLLSGAQDNKIKVWNTGMTTLRNSMKSIFQIQTQNSVKKCEWNVDDPLMMTSISTTENRVSVWHLKKPFLQQYILKGVSQEDFNDFQWIEPGQNLLCAQGDQLISYDLKFFENQRRTSIYSEESQTHVLRPYAKIQASSCDFNLGDDLALVSEAIPTKSFEPIPLDAPFFEHRFADEYLKYLGSNINIQAFFESPLQLVGQGASGQKPGGLSLQKAPSQSKVMGSTTSSPIAMARTASNNMINKHLSGSKLKPVTTCSDIREMKVYQVSEILNSAMVSPSNLLGHSNISMPSGDVFECLALNYKFHSTERDHPEKRVEQLCKANTQIALAFNLHETALTWMQLADIAVQMRELRQEFEQVLLDENFKCLIEVPKSKVEFVNRAEKRVFGKAHKKKEDRKQAAPKTEAPAQPLTVSTEEAKKDQQVFENGFFSLHLEQSESEEESTGHSSEQDPSEDELPKALQPACHQVDRCMREPKKGGSTQELPHANRSGLKMSKFQQLKKLYKFQLHLIDMVIETIRYYSNSGDIVTAAFIMFVFYNDEIKANHIFNDASYFHSKWPILHSKNCRHSISTRLALIMQIVRDEPKLSAENVQQRKGGDAKTIGGTQLAAKISTAPAKKKGRQELEDRCQLEELASILYSFHLKLQDQYDGFIDRLLLSFIDFLKRFQLPNLITEILKFGPQRERVKGAMGVADKPFDVLPVCQFCKSKDESQCKGGICQSTKCKQTVARCSVCQQRVSGMLFWCQGCSHGGHQNHIIEWFQIGGNTQCPVAGCGHNCIAAAAEMDA